MKPMGRGLGTLRSLMQLRLACGEGQAEDERNAHGTPHEGQGISQGGDVGNGAHVKTSERTDAHETSRARARTHDVRLGSALWAAAAARRLLQVRTALSWA